jgi:hypothetical protein
MIGPQATIPSSPSIRTRIARLKSKRWSINAARQRWIYIDLSVASDFALLQSRLSGFEFFVWSKTHDNRRWIVTAHKAEQPATYFLLDRDQQSVTELFRAHPALIPYHLAPMHSVHAKARDGLDLVSYLTLPAEIDEDRPPEPLPMVLVVHGGPWARDIYGYHPYHPLRSARRISHTLKLIPQEPSPRSPQSASLWRLGLYDLGEPLRQDDQLGRGLVRRRSSGRELLLVGLPCGGPFARQGGQSGYRAVGTLPFGNEIAVEPLVVRLQRGDMFAQRVHKFRVWGFAGLFARLFSGRTHNICGDQHL